MAEPPLRRKPTTELEAKLARGDPTVKEAVISLLDTVLHADLTHLYPTELPDDVRAKIVVDVTCDFLDGTVRYDPLQASIETLAKRRARQRAIDYFRRTDVAERSRPNLKRREERLRSPETPGDVLTTMDSLIERNMKVERIIIAIQQLPSELREAALAYARHGDSDPKLGGKPYSTLLAEKCGISPNLAAQRWRRAKEKLQAMLGIDFSHAERSGQ